MKKKQASQETVNAFIKAVYPEMTELSVAMGSEESILKDATKLIVTLDAALLSSLGLQSHYARLLNQYDGGKRKRFHSVDEWIERLRECGELKREGESNG